jgi:endonuclease/exonuclease/phosphatase family metal-dependent hydrolase
VGQVNQYLASLAQSKTPFIIGGDFNLLPPVEAAYRKLPEIHQSYYNPQSEIKALFDSYQALPSLEEVSGADFAKWYTYFPNDPAIPYADSTLDYLFVQNSTTVVSHSVRQQDTQRISDHFPVSAVIQLP